MEGVLDHLMREMLTDINDYDLCVTEFVRVIDQLLPDHVFYRLCPELKQNSQTPCGTPVHIQLLGQEPHWMAENAVRAAELGAQGIDLNFGCPAKTVNKSHGGAALLKNPSQIYQIVKATRQAINPTIPVTAKIRLGWENADECDEIVDAIEQAGATALTIHARTKMDGYRAEAIAWERIAQIKQNSRLPITANGEIWNHQDALDCMQASQCDSLMVCRGAFNLPNLGNVVKYDHPPMPWPQVVELLITYSQYEIQGDKGLYYPNRVKQWLNFLRKQYSEAATLFTQIRVHNRAQPIVESLHQYRDRLAHFKSR